MGEDHPFDEAIDYRAHPECYPYTPNEKGVFKAQPYKGELLPLWGFADEQTAREAIEGLRDKFEEYRREGDFPGMDMVRKYLRMGFTRSMRYAKYPGGQKYDEDGEVRDEERWADEEKRQVAVLFRDAWEEVREDEDYRQARESHEHRPCEVSEDGSVAYLSSAGEEE